MRDPSAPKAADLEHRIALCKQADVVVDSRTMELRRSDVVWTWARIKSFYGLAAFINSQHGYAIIDGMTRATHSITFRYGMYLSIGSTAWVYERRRKTEPRWYKVLGFAESSQWVTLNVRLVEKSDMVLPPNSTFAPQPSQVEL